MVVVSRSANLLGTLDTSLYCIVLCRMCILGSGARCEVDDG